MFTAADAAAAVAVFVLVSLAIVHLAWAFGSSWPTKSPSELARLVVGVEASGQMPGRGLTLGVVALLLGAAAWVLVVRGLVTVPVGDLALKTGAWALVGVFGLRGLGGFFELKLRPHIRATPYATWNVRLYSPLSLLLALSIGIATVAPL